MVHDHGRHRGRQVGPAGHDRRPQGERRRGGRRRDDALRNNRLHRHPHRGEGGQARRGHSESLRLGPGQRAEGVREAGAGQGEDRRGGHDRRRADRPASRLCHERRRLGADLGPEDQYRQLKAVHPGRDRQVQPHPDLALLPRLRGDDADPGSGAPDRHDRHRRGHQGAGRP